MYKGILKSLHRKLHRAASGSPGGPRGGFTMTEMLVTLIIAIIVIGISGALIITSTNLFSRSALRDQQTSIAETVLTFTADRFLYAKTIEALDPALGAPDANVAFLQIVDPDSGKGASTGQLVYRRNGDDGDPVNVFGPAFYHGYRISLAYAITRPEGGGAASITITVNVYQEGSAEAVVTRTTTKPMLNYQGEVKAIGGDNSFIMISYLDTPSGPVSET